MQDRAKNHTFEEWERLGKGIDLILESAPEPKNEVEQALLALVQITSTQYNQIEQLRSDVIDLQREVETLQQQIYPND